MVGYLQGGNITKTLSAYICKPNRDVICRIKGITKYDVSLKGINDYSEINFEVKKYVTNQTTFEVEKNMAYPLLHAFCEIKVPEFEKDGYFIIINEPEITASGTMDESKVFTAMSYEAVLQYENLINFKVNQGTDDSIEMNDDNVDEMGIPLTMIQLYNSSDPKSSLLDLVLRDDYYGFSVGRVDPSIASLQRSFDIDTQNVYSFLTSDMATAFRCIVTFDNEEKLINVTSIDNYGTDTNIYLSLDHFLTNIDISQRSDDIYTVFNVSGDNDLDIAAVNFGSNKVINISYPLSFLDASIQSGYEAFLTHREGLRNSYSEATKDYAYLIERMDCLLDRQPDDVINNNWASDTYYSDQDLQDFLIAAYNLVTIIEGLYKDGPDEDVNYDELNASMDASLYYSYRDVVIPDIETEINARAVGTHSTKDERVNTDLVYEMHGLYDLETIKITFEDKINSYREMGYANTDWDFTSNISEATWNEHHNDYLEYQQHYVEINELIGRKREQVEALQAEIDEKLAEIKSIADSASLANYSGLTDEQKQVITSLYRESDYLNSNFLITDIDDAVSTVVKEKELFDAAVERLEIESLPQFTWTVQSDNLFAMTEFASLRDELSIGDFITLGFDTYGIADYLVNLMEEKPGGIKFRVVQINFSGIDFNSLFEIMFSDMIHTRTYRNDLESLIENFVSSKTNQISVSTQSTAKATAAKISASLIKPYVEVLNARIDELSVRSAEVAELSAVNAHIESLIADFIQTQEFQAAVAEITGTLTVFDLHAANITTDHAITLVSDANGSIAIANSKMIFSDATGHPRMQIGLNNSGEYDIQIYGSASPSGTQAMLFDSTGIKKAAISNQTIENNMIQWSGISEGVDAVDGKPYFSADKVVIEGSRLSDVWNNLKGIEIIASQQFFTSSLLSHYPDTITLTPQLHLLGDVGQVYWYYYNTTTSSYIQITNTTTSTTAPYLDSHNQLVIPYGWSTLTDSIMIKADYGGNDTYTDVMTIFRIQEGSDTCNIILSNEAMTVATDDNHYPTETGPYYCDVLVLNGTNTLTQTNSSSPNVGYYYMTATCSQTAVTVNTTTPGRIQFTLNTGTKIIDNFDIYLYFTIGGMSTMITKQISISASVAGESVITVSISSSAGVIFKNGNISSILTATVYKGSTDITSQVSSFEWSRKDQYGILDESWTQIAGSSIEITDSDVINKSVFQCKVTL